MKAARMRNRPGFALMKQTDIQNMHYMQMPRWLFSDPRYADMSLEAKVTYTFLLNRFQLSRRKGWVNDEGEVFVIFPRQSLAQELRICEKRVTTAFRKLIELNLIWEKRCGQGEANQIYLAKIEPMPSESYECAPFNSPEYEDIGVKSSNTKAPYGDLSTYGEDLAMEDGRNWGDSATDSGRYWKAGMNGPSPPGTQFQNCQIGRSESVKLTVPEPSNPPFQNRRIGGSETAELAVQEAPNRRSSKNNINTNRFSQKEVSQSVLARAGEGQTDGHFEDEEELELTGILEACELFIFPPDLAKVFENAIERLFYSESFRIGKAVLPQKRVRSKLHLLDGIILQDAASKLAANTERKVKNSTAYTMATIFNCITESESDCLVDPYLNGLKAPQT